MEGLYQLKTDLDKNGIFLSFSGPISQNLMVELGGILKKQMEMAETDTSTIMKVFDVLVEQSQNIMHHSADSSSDEDKPGETLITGTIAVGFFQNKYFVLGGNKINKTQESALRSRLEQMQHLNKDELKALYHQQRKQGETGLKGNAGLGLIDLARKSSEPIQYSFIPIDDIYTFFSIRTLISVDQSRP